MGRPRLNPNDPKWHTEPVLLICKESFTVRCDGADHTFTADRTRIMSNHPWIQGYEHLFEPASPSRGFEVESATAAPGERRGATVT